MSPRALQHRALAIFLLVSRYNQKLFKLLASQMRERFPYEETVLSYRLANGAFIVMNLYHVIWILNVVNFPIFLFCFIPFYTSLSKCLNKI